MCFRRKQHVVTVADFKHAPLGQDFRYPDDPAHIIRYQEPDPEASLFQAGDYAGLYTERIPVAGASYRQEAIVAFIAGRERRLELKRHPFEDHPNAVMVVGHWLHGQSHKSEQLGWLPRDVAELAAEHYPECDLHATLTTMFKAGGGKTAGVRFNLWYSRGPKPKKARRKRP